MAKKRSYKIKDRERLAYIFDAETRKAIDIPDSDTIEVFEGRIYYSVLIIKRLPPKFIRENLTPVYLEEMRLTAKDKSIYRDYSCEYLTVSEIPHWLVAKLFEMGYDPYILPVLRSEPLLQAY